MWDLPGPGLEPVSPALAGGFLTTGPRGKSGLGEKEILWDGMIILHELWSAEPRQVSVGMEFALFKLIGSSLACR